MVDRKDIGSWLDGPGARTGAPTAYPGQRFGMPSEGAGSVGRWGRRLVGVLIDWTVCQLIAYGLFGVPLVQAGGGSFVPLAIFAVENLVLVGTLGQTLGHRIVRLRVRSTEGRPARPFQVVVRTVLLCLFLPAMFWDADGRGLHDKAAGTVIIRT